MLIGIATSVGLLIWLLERHYTEHHSKDDSQHIDARIYPTVADGLAALKAGSLTLDAFVYDRPILEWNRRRDFPDDVTVLEKVFARENYAIALPENAPLRLKIDQAMLDELRGPGWQAILQRYLGGGD